VTAATIPATLLAGLLAIVILFQGPFAVALPLVQNFGYTREIDRLRIRWERRPELHQAFMHLACAFICQRFLRAL
jgi:hypothetical protein